MRSLRERLQEMTPQPGSGRLDLSGAPTSAGVEAFLTGSERSNRRGAYFLAERSIATDQLEPLVSRASIAPGAFLPHWPGEARLSPGNLLFIDTETTGLAGGTGTHAFLIGAGYFSNGSLQLRQYFMRDLYEEPAVLADFENLLAEFPAIVTFNGKSFDWPLLETRLIMHGHRDFPRPLHWDLLHPARRIWRYRLRDCSLGNLEARLFGVVRHDDVPGYLIPALYFDYLRSRDPAPLRPVFHHNAEDIVTLGRLANLFLVVDETPASALRHSEDLLALGLLRLERCEFRDGGQLIMQALEEPSLAPDLACRGIVALARATKRRGDGENAALLWERLCEAPGVGIESVVLAHVELAKHCEHVLRDYARAIRHTERALRIVELSGIDRERSHLLHRLSRLIRRGTRAH